MGSPKTEIHGFGFKAQNRGFNSVVISGYYMTIIKLAD
jgi:hypothetical protein